MARYYNKKYIEKILTDPFPLLPEDERIYFNVPYKARHFAKQTNCGFDSVQKLWFTGIHNAHLSSLVMLYGINDATSEKAMNLLKEQLQTISLRKEKALSNDVNGTTTDKE